MKFPNQWIASNFSNIDCCISYYICRFPCSSLCVINFPASGGSTDTRRFPVYSILTILSVFAIVSLITFRTNSRLTRIYSIKEPIVISTNSNFSTILSISSISSINAIFSISSIGTVNDRIRFSIIKCDLETSSNIFNGFNPFAFIHKLLQIGNAGFVCVNLCLQIVDVIIIVFTAYIGDSRKCQRPEEHHFYKFSFHNYLKITLIIYY